MDFRRQRSCGIAEEATMIQNSRLQPVNGGSHGSRDDGKTHISSQILLGRLNRLKPS